MWFLTVNANLEENFEKLKKYECRYKLIGEIEKAPTTGHEHFHAVLYFNNARNFKSLQSKLPGIDIRASQATIEQARDYAGKEGIRLEIGEAPHQGLKMSIAELKKASTESLIETYGKNWLVYSKARDVLNTSIKVSDWNKEVKVIYIYGPSGVGKSNYVYEWMLKNNVEQFDEVKHANQFWMGVSNESTVCVYDDFRDSHMPPSEFINFIDYRTHMLNIKGGCLRNTYKTILITSVQSPDALYKNFTATNEEPKRQWLRRMEIIKLEESITQPGDPEY